MLHRALATEKLKPNRFGVKNENQLSFAKTSSGQAEGNPWICRWGRPPQACAATVDDPFECASVPKAVAATATPTFVSNNGYDGFTLFAMGGLRSLKHTNASSPQFKYAHYSPLLSRPVYSRQLIRAYSAFPISRGSKWIDFHREFTPILDLVLPINRKCIVHYACI